MFFTQNQTDYLRSSCFAWLKIFINTKNIKDYKEFQLRFSTMINIIPLQTLDQFLEDCLEDVNDTGYDKMLRDFCTQAIKESKDRRSAA